MIVATLACVALLSGCAHHTSAFGPPPVPGGGTVAGRFVSRASNGSGAAPEAQQRIGLYTKALITGPVLQHPPQPFVTTTTTSQGFFEFRRLAPGRYFLTAVSSGSGAQGRWVSVTKGRGVSILLVRCTNCPVPL